VNATRPPLTTTTNASGQDKAETRAGSNQLKIQDSNFKGLKKPLLCSSIYRYKKEI